MPNISMTFNAAIALTNTTHWNNRATN